MKLGCWIFVNAFANWIPFRVSGFSFLFCIRNLLKKVNLYVLSLSVSTLLFFNELDQICSDSVHHFWYVFEFRCWPQWTLWQTARTWPWTNCRYCLYVFQIDDWHCEAFCISALTYSILLVNSLNVFEEQSANASPWLGSLCCLSSPHKGSLYSSSRWTSLRISLYLRCKCLYFYAHSL